MSEKSQQQLSLFGQTSSAGDSHARIYPSPETVKGWLEEEADCGTNTIELSVSLNRNGWSWKTYQDFFQAKAEGTLPSSFEGWMNSGTWGCGKLLTVNSLEYPSAAAVCSLSDILETQVDLKYFLSAKACRGILRRADKRGKDLPPMLLRALQAVGTKDRDTTGMRR